MTPDLHRAVFVHLTALPSWLALNRTQRHEVIAAQVGPALARHPECSVRWFDAESMTADCSDVLLVETEDLRGWHHLWEEVRDSDLFAVPYFRLDRLIVGSEDAYEDYERSLPRNGDESAPAA